MPVNFMIKDGTGTDVTAEVNDEHALKVYLADQSISISNINELIPDLTRQKQYRDWLRTSAGAYEMNVNGSSTPILFEETAEANKVKWITSWRLIMNGTYLEINTNDFRRFGAAATAPGLTNGMQFYFVQGGRTINVFLENVKKIGDFLDYADGYTNLVNAVSSQSDYLAFDFVFDKPVALPAGSNDKIVMQVSDNLTALELMRVVVRGWQEFL